MLVMGRIRAPFGVRGWVRVQSFTDPPANLLDYSVWNLSGPSGLEERRVQDAGMHGQWIVAKLEGIEDRDSAETLVGQDIMVLRQALPETSEGEYYWQDLVGMEVLMNRNGTSLGVVDHLIATGANDVLVVHNSRERLIPFIASVVVEVDLKGRRILVDWDGDF